MGEVKAQIKTDEWCDKREVEVTDMMVGVWWGVCTCKDEHSINNTVTTTTTRALTNMLSAQSPSN